MNTFKKQVEVQGTKKLDSVKRVRNLNNEELHSITGGSFPWKALKEIIDWVVDKLRPKDTPL